MDAEGHQGNIEHEITATRATTLEGLAVKWRLAEEVISNDENELENRLFRSIYEDAVEFQSREREPDPV